MARKGAGREVGINAFSLPEPKREARDTIIRAGVRVREIRREKTTVEVGWPITVRVSCPRGL